MRNASALVVLCCLPLTAMAQQPIVDQFEMRSQTRDGFTMPYRLFVPENYDPDVAYPLVLVLHGAGERGTDNERHIRPHRLATSWADPVNQAEYPAFVVAPQVPPGGRWTADQDPVQSAFNNEELTTLAILDSLETEFNIDPDRVYVTGLSLGGHGTWDFISRLPSRFAAAIPMSGIGYASQAENLLHIPIWAFHGESDTVVRASGSRSPIFAMENLGRDVIYTECKRSLPLVTNFDCPDPISTDSLAEAIEAHADLIYTGVENGGHGPWSVWYDHSLLNDWLFSKYRVDPDAITIEQPAFGVTWSGTNSITWSASGPATDTVEVWLSVNNGESWQQVDATELGAGSYALDTTPYPDTPFAQIRLFVQNGRGFIYGRHTSAPFVIDNAGDAPPAVILNDESIRFNPRVTNQVLNLEALVADPEGSAVTATVFYSIDGGETFADVLTQEFASSQGPVTISIPVATLPNTLSARVRVDLSDGANSTSASTVVFEKLTMRETNVSAEHVQGEGVGSITMHFIEPADLTGHRYRITFDDSDPSAKTYSVLDLDESEMVLTDVPLSDGVRESPLFDGMRLVVVDAEEGMANLEETGWIEGDTDLGVSIAGGSVLISVLRVQLLATENEYELTIADAVVGTSESMFGIPAEDLRFSVISRSDGLPRPVLFRDNNGDGLPGNRDVLYILEEDAEGGLAPAWEFRFNATSGTILPEPGDVFLFVPLRKLSSEDVFEFVAAVGVGTEGQELPDDIAFLSSFPNPFSERMTITYRLAMPSDVTLELYDLLGRRVGVLLEHRVAAGEHYMAWDGTQAGKGSLAAGLYLLRLNAQSVTTGAEQSVQRPVLRVR